MGRNLGPLNIKDSYEGLVQISGSQLTDGSGSLIPSLDVSASYATTASFALNVTPTPTGSFMVTGSVTDATLTFTKGDASTFPLTVNNVANAVSASHAVSSDTAISASHAVNADSAISSSYATTASYAENASMPTLAEVLTAGNTTLSGQSIIISGSGLITRVFDGDGIISGIAGGDYTIKAGSVNARLVLTGNGNNDNIIKLDTTGVKISGSVDSQNNITAPLFIGDLQGNADTATSASHALYALTASFLPADTNLNINSISASSAVFQSASIGYLQSISGSAKIIGDAFIILNNDTPTQRYAGLVVQDSGSTNNTASFEFDGQTNDWFYEYTDDGGATTEHGVALFGAEYNTKGSPSYPATNVLQKGNGGHHLLDSSITDDGTLVSINANVSASGYISASSFIGDGSQLSGISTEPFPYTGSADISGSIDLVGDMIIGTGNTTTLNGKNLIGGNSNTISSTNTNSNVVLGGNSNEITNGGLNIMLGGSDKQITSTGVRNAIINGWGGATDGISAGSNQTIIGGVVSNISATGASNTIIGGRGGEISGGANKSVIIGGEINQVSGGQRGVVIGGYGNNEQGGNGAILGGANNSTNTGQFIVVVGGSNNSITGTSENSVVIGGTGGSIVSHNNSVILGGSSLSTTKASEVVVPSLSIYGEIEQGDTNSNLGTNTAILASGHSLISASVNDVAIIASTGSYQSSTQPGRTAIIASDNSYIDSTSAGNNDDIALIGTLNSRFTGGGARQAVIAGTNNAYNNGSRFSFIGGGESHVMEGYYANAIVGGSGNRMLKGTNSAIAGGGSNRIGNTTQTDYGFIGGGSNNYLDGQNNAIIAGTGNDNNQLRAVILGGENNDIDGGQGGVVVGGANNRVSHNYSITLGGFGLTTSKASEVVVEHLSTNGAVVQDVKALAIVANVAELDASLGNLFTLTLQNGVNTELQLTNQSAGQTFQVQITNNATSAGTITFDSQFEFEGGTAFTATATTSAVDILTFTCFAGGNVQCVSAKNFS